MVSSIIDILRGDHRDVSRLIVAIRNSADGEQSKRKQIFARVMNLLAMHMAFEERCVYPILAARWLMREESLQAVEDHELIRYWLHDIAQCRIADERWMAKVTVLSGEFGKHVDGEERPGGMFDDLDRALTARELEELTEAYAKSIRFEAAMREKGDAALWRARMSGSRKMPPVHMMHVRSTP